MPLLDRTGAYTPDSFSREAGANRPLQPFEGAEPGALAIEVANTTAPESLVPFFGAEMIAIGFPAYADGRGFTLARRLRHLGYSGTLRAVGPLIADQFAYALACGFDELELPEAHAARQPESHWKTAARAFSATYQRGYARGLNILDQRRASRAGGTHG